MAKKPPRKLASQYPVFLNLENVPVLIVGGGLVAVRKLETLLSAGARVTLVALEPHSSLTKYKGQAKLLRRRFRVPDLKGKRLVFAATHDPRLNAGIAREAKKRGIFVNVASPPDAGDVQIPGSIRRGAFCVAISTGGSSPMLARTWRMKLEKMIGPEWGEWVALLEQKRKRILSEVRDEVRRTRLLQRLGHTRWAGLLKSKGAAHVRREVDRLIDAFK
jgi:siroheme synthase-like protein